MSTQEQEARALKRAQVLLRDISSGKHPVRPITALRKEARDILRHYPLAPEDYGAREWERGYKRGLDTTINN